MDRDQSPSINLTRGRPGNRGTSNREGSAHPLVPRPATLVSSAARTARQTWLVGLGLVSVAEAAGAKAFQALVETGGSWERVRRRESKKRAEQVRTLVERGARAVEGVEERVHDRVRNALARIGGARQEDVEDLRREVDALSEKLERLTDAFANRHTETDR